VSWNELGAKTKKQKHKKARQKDKKPLLTSSLLKKFLSVLGFSSTVFGEQPREF
jgi:hypothetical protein